MPRRGEGIRLGERRIVRRGACPAGAREATLRCSQCTTHWLRNEGGLCQAKRRFWRGFPEFPLSLQGRAVVSELRLLNFPYHCEGGKADRGYSFPHNDGGFCQAKRPVLARISRIPFVIARLEEPWQSVCLKAMEPKAPWLLQERRLFLFFRGDEVQGDGIHAGL